jgi:hypothetical protein
MTVQGHATRAFERAQERRMDLFAEGSRASRASFELQSCPRSVFAEGNELLGNRASSKILRRDEVDPRVDEFKVYDVGVEELPAFRAVEPGCSRADTCTKLVRFRQSKHATGPTYRTT